MLIFLNLCRVNIIYIFLNYYVGVIDAVNILVKEGAVVYLSFLHASINSYKLLFLVYIILFVIIL